MNFFWRCHLFIQNKFTENMNSISAVRYHFFYLCELVLETRINSRFMKTL